MSTAKCRIPLGNFYGHMVILPEMLSSEQLKCISSQSTNDLNNQLNVLNMLFEDISCRFSLACSKLKDLLHPLFMSDTSNATHLSAYIEVMKDKTGGAFNENMKIFTIYQVKMLIICFY